MGLGDQLVVALGALGQHVFTRMAERDRFTRELRIRWDQRRLDAYTAYVCAVKMAGTYANQVHELRVHGGDDVAESENLRSMGAFVARRIELFEALPMLADGPTIEAGHELNRAVWDLELPARTGIVLAESDWHALADRWITALNNFHAAARASLSVVGTYARRDTAALTVANPEEGHTLYREV